MTTSSRVLASLTRAAMFIRKWLRLSDIPWRSCNKGDLNGALIVSSRRIHRRSRADRRQQGAVFQPGRPDRLSVRICPGGFSWLPGDFSCASSAAYAAYVGYQRYFGHLADRLDRDRRIAL